MRGTGLLASTLIVLAAAPFCAAARETKALEPSSQWVLDYANERCSLARTFGSGDDSIILQIISYGSWNDFHTLLTGPLAPNAFKTDWSVRVSFPDDKERRDPVSALEGLSGKATAVAFALYFGPYKPLDKGKRLRDEEKRRLAHERDQPVPDFDRQVDSITFEFGNGRQVALHVQNMAAPLAALRHCVDDLYKSWGISPEVQESLSREPRPLPQAILALQDHYPAAKLGSSAYVPVRIHVDATGQPLSCVTQVETVDESFKKAVCGNLTRFEPALDKDGNPVESMYYTSVAFLS